MQNIAKTTLCFVLLALAMYGLYSSLFHLPAPTRAERKRIQYWAGQSNIDICYEGVVDFLQKVDNLFWAFLGLNNNFKETSRTELN